MDSLNRLFKRRDEISESAATAVGGVDSQIQSILTVIWDDWKQLQTALAALESYDNVGYQGTEWGIESWTRLSLDAVAERERDYFDNYLADRGTRADYENDCLLQSLGDDHYQIQDDTRRDNGVWQGTRRVIDESDYLDASGDVDEDKRNALIEADMERSGCFPGVFRVTNQGDIYPVDTRKK